MLVAIETFILVGSILEEIKIVEKICTKKFDNINHRKRFAKSLKLKTFLFLLGSELKLRAYKRNSSSKLSMLTLVWSILIC